MKKVNNKMSRIVECKKCGIEYDNVAHPRCYNCQCEQVVLKDISQLERKAHYVQKRLTIKTPCGVVRVSQELEKIDDIKMMKRTPIKYNAHNPEAIEWLKDNYS